jgi:opacity protein-like surface antigen
MNLFKYIVVVAFLITSNHAFAKKWNNPYGADWAFGAHFGGTVFFGDLTLGESMLSATPFSKYFYDNLRLMAGITLERSIGSIIIVSGNMQYGKIQSTKSTSNAYFVANVFEYNLMANINLTNLILGVDRRRHFMIYGGIGLGLSESRSWKYTLDKEKLIGTNGFGSPKSPNGTYVPMTETMVPIALGIKFYVGNNLTINLEGSGHAINSDKIDATPNKNSSFIASLEGYTYYSLGIEYWFGDIHRTSKGKSNARYSSSKGSASEYWSKNKKGKTQFKKARRRFKFT